MRAWFVVLAAAACSGSGSGPSGPVTIRAVDSWVTDDEVIAQPVDLARLEVFAPVGDSLEPLTVEAAGDGTALVPDAPDGIYYLRYEGEWIAAWRREVSLDQHRLGRPGAVPAAAPATLSLSLSNAVPWQEGDLLQLYSAGAGLWRMAPVAGAGAGATDVQATIDLAAEGLPRVEGDPTWAAQMTTRDFAGHAYHALVAAAALPAFDLMVEPEAAIAAGLAPAAEVELDVAWRIAAFDAIRLDSVPVIGLSYYDLGVAALRQAGVAGQYGFSADLAVLRITDAAGRDQAGQLGFANPFPADWDIMLTAVAWYPRSHRLAEDDAPAILFDAIWVRDLADRLASTAGVVAPQLSPPRDLRVNGSPAIEGATLGGDMPEISWQQPALGSPAGYEIEVHALTSSGGATSASRTALIRTARTSVRLPPMALDRGAAGFVVRVAAVATAADLWATPLAVRTPYAWASTQSGVLWP